MSDNGSRPHLVASQVPIVGQPVKPTGGFMTVMAQCNCGGPDAAFLLIGAAPAVCRSCHRQYVLLAASVDSQTGQMVANIGVATPARPS